MTRKFSPQYAFFLSALSLSLCADSQSAAAQAASDAAHAGASQAARMQGTRNALMKPAARRAPARKLIKIKARAGDTLEMLGDRFGVGADELAVVNGLPVRVQLQQGRELLIPLPTPESLKAASERLARHGGADRQGTDGADSPGAAGAWENVQGVLFRKGSGARAVEPAAASDEASSPVETEKARGAKAAKIVEASEALRSTATQPVWIYLVGGARVEADSVSETEEGVWYTRGNLTVFVERSRVERVERERVAAEAPSDSGQWTERGWTTGNPKFDALIRENGARFGVDPYLIFCVMEQESHFKPWVVSPKGARGLMQLMPGTAAFLGVRRPMDPAENIMGGTKYLKMLLEQFDGRVDLVLAGYNAGEGAVMKYGGRVPPYRETRNYVQRISKRYGQSRSSVGEGSETSAARPRSR